MASTQTDWNDYPLTLNAHQVREILGIGKNAVYSTIKSEGFPLVMIGQKMLIPRDNLRIWIEKQVGDTHEKQ